MGRYCSVADVAARYRKVVDVQSYQTAVDSNYITFAENDLDGMLGKYFAVPFSSSNVTARDLSVDLTYIKIIQFDDTKKADVIFKKVGSKIADLIIGASGMVHDDGSILFSSSAQSQAWSNTMNCNSSYFPTEYPS